MSIIIDGTCVWFRGNSHYTLSTCLPITVLIVVLAKSVHIVIHPLILIAHCGVHSMAHTESGPYKDLISLLSHTHSRRNCLGGGSNVVINPSRSKIFGHTPSSRFTRAPDGTTKNGWLTCTEVTF